MFQKFPHLYEVNHQVLYDGPRGMDMNPYTVDEVLGNGQSYRVSRVKDGKVERKVFKEDELTRVYTEDESKKSPD